MKICQSGRIALEDRKFNVDSNIKDEFINSIVVENTKKQTKGILLKVDLYEEKINKSVFNFSVQEIEDMITSEFSLKSVQYIRTCISYTKNYVNFCVLKGLTEENKLNLLPNAIKYVNVDLSRQQYISFEEMRNYQKKFVNVCDKLMFELLFMGIKPESIRKLKDEDIDYVNKTLTYENQYGEVKTINIDDYVIELIKATVMQERYIINNGNCVSKNNQEQVIGRGMGEKTLRLVESDYIFKSATGKVKVVLDESDGMIRKNLIQERVRYMRSWLDLSNLTTTTLNYSGMLNMAKKIKAYKGELDNNDYSIICDTFNYCEPSTKPNSSIKNYSINIGKLKEFINLNL